MTYYGDPTRRSCGRPDTESIRHLSPEHLTEEGEWYRITAGAYRDIMFSEKLRVRLATVAILVLPATLRIGNPSSGRQGFHIKC